MRKLRLIDQVQTIGNLGMWLSELSPHWVPEHRGEADASVRFSVGKAFLKGTHLSLFMNIFW